MGSPAYAKYHEGVSRARVIREILVDARIRPTNRAQSQVLAHASLATIVAAWDAYLNEIVANFYTEIADPVNPKFNSIHTVAKQQAQNLVDRFNTPNWENSRTLLTRATGFDPYNYWTWPPKYVTPLLVQEKLNQILKVRHSFAHGFSIPAYPWNRTPSGQVRLNATVLKEVEGFFNQLVRRTDAGMKNHLSLNFHRPSLW